MATTKLNICARALLLGAAMIVPAFANSQAAVAQAPQSNVVSLNIPAQDLSLALKEFARQGRQQLLYSPEIARGKTSAAISGRYSPEAGLRQLLSGTGIKLSTTSSGAFLLKNGDLRGNGVAGAPNAGSETASSNGDASPGAGEAVAGGPEEYGESEEIVVTGTSIRGITNPTAPTLVFTRDEIEKTGASTATRLFETLPQNFNLTNQSGVSVPGSADLGEQGSSVNLRGIGEGTTLVLLNGHRLAPGFDGSAVDISAIPLTALDRVEILTDGASAIYGADAVGGVVNFILRRDFEGAETTARYGRSSGNVDEYRLSQTVGTSWATGNALLSGGYYHRDLLKSSNRGFVPADVSIGSLLPQDDSYHVIFAGRQQVDRIELSLESLYTLRKSYNETGQVSLSSNVRSRNSQLSVVPGLARDIGRDWQATFVGNYASNNLRSISNSLDLGADGPFISTTRFQLFGGTAKVDGPIARLPAGAVKIALGVDIRHEWLKDRSRLASGAPSFRLQGDFERSIKSGFAEAFIPIFSETNRISGVENLLLSLAARYDSYSNLGSSFDPKIGVLYEPLRGLKFRGSFGTSYVAPTLTTFSYSSNAAIAFTLDDPGSPNGTSHQLILLGNDVAGLKPQEAKSLSLGFSLEPESLPGVRLSANYYRISYKNRVANPPDRSTLLSNPDSFSDLIIRNPTLSQVNDFIATGNLGTPFVAYLPDFSGIDENFDPSTIAVIIDARKRNLSGTLTEGLDASLSYRFPVGGGDATLGVDGTYIFKLVQRLSSTSAPFDTVDTFNNPPDLRVRASAGWDNTRVSINGFLNYTDSYTDARFVPFLPATKVDSLTTVDLHLGLNLGQFFSSGVLSASRLGLTVENVFGQSPPKTAVVDPFRDLGFDPTNANPRGRLVAVEITKAW